MLGQQALGGAGGSWRCYQQVAAGGCAYGGLGIDTGRQPAHLKAGRLQAAAAAFLHRHAVTTPQTIAQPRQQSFAWQQQPHIAA